MSHAYIYLYVCSEKLATLQRATHLQLLRYGTNAELTLPLLGKQTQYSLYTA